MKDSMQAIIYLLAAGGIIFLGNRALAALKKDIPYGARKVACLGDSITASGLYGKELAKHLPEGSIVKSFGYEGQGTAYIANKLDKVIDWNPTDVVILAGVNDFGKTQDVEIIKSNLSKMYAKVHANGIRVVAVQLTPWCCYSNAVNNCIKKTATVNEWIANDSTADSVVSTVTMSDNESCLMASLNSGDGLHLSNTGQRYLGLLIADQAFDWR